MKVAGRLGLLIILGYATGCNLDLAKWGGTTACTPSTSSPCPPKTISISIPTTAALKNMAITTASAQTMTITTSNTETETEAVYTAPTTGIATAPAAATATSSRLPVTNVYVLLDGFSTCPVTASGSVAPNYMDWDFYSPVLAPLLSKNPNAVWVMACLDSNWAPDQKYPIYHYVFSSSPTVVNVSSPSADGAQLILSQARAAATYITNFLIYSFSMGGGATLAYISSLDAATTTVQAVVVDPIDGTQCNPIMGLESMVRTGGYGSSTGRLPAACQQAPRLGPLPSGTSVANFYQTGGILHSGSIPTATSNTDITSKIEISKTLIQATDWFPGSGIDASTYSPHIAAPFVPDPIAAYLAL